MNSTDSNDLFAGGGEMGQRTREFDWAQTPLGKIESWPQSLKTAVRIMLGSRQAMWLSWGPQCAFLCNDACARTTLASEPALALGKPAREVWSEHWEGIGPHIESVLQTGEPSSDQRLQLFLPRRGLAEETYHAFSYSALPSDDGGVGGVLCVASEETEQRIGQRRVQTLRELASRTLEEPRSVEAACRTASEVLGQNPYDLPFTLLYLLDPSGSSVTLVGRTGVNEDAQFSPRRIDLRSFDGPWPLNDVLESGHWIEIPDLPPRLGESYEGVWPESPHHAVVHPLAKPGQKRQAGFLVAGTSPRRPFDDGYRCFLEMVAGQIAAAIANTSAYKPKQQHTDSLPQVDRANTAFSANVGDEFPTPLTLMLGSGTLTDSSARKQSEAASDDARTRFDSALAAGEIGTWDWDIVTDRVYADRNLATIFGVDAEKAAGGSLDDFTRSIHPDDRNRVEELIAAAIKNKNFFEAEYRIYVNDSVRWIIARGRVERDADDRAVRFPGIVIDVTERRRVERLQERQRRILQLMAEDVPLNEILDALVGMVEDQSEAGMVASVLLFDHEEKCLRLASAPHLPEAYNRAVDRLTPGPNVGSCGTAAYYREPVYVSDIEHDPRWADYRDLALGFNLRACWSTPILASNGELLGTFAMYYPAVREPTDHDVHLVETATRTAAIAIERRRSEQRLKEQEEQYRSIFESTSDAVLIFDTTGRLTEVNPAACRLHGYRRDELIGVSGQKIIHPADHPKFARFLESVQSGRPFQVEGTHLRKDGTPISVQVTGSSFHYAGQLALLAIVHDVTEQRKAVAALKESEALLRFTLDATDVGQWDLDLLTQTAERTLRHDQIFGYDRKQDDWSYDRFLNEHVHPDDRQRVDELFQKAKRESTDWEFECRIHRADGVERWIWVTSSPYLKLNDKPVRIAGLVMDITERKNAEARERKLLEQAATANAKFQAFFDQGPLFAVIIGLDGTVLDASQLCLDACGYDRQQVVGRPFWQCPWWSADPDLAGKVEQACRDAANGQGYRGELDYYVASGALRMLDIHILPITDHSGQVLFVAPTGTDITERKRAENAILWHSRQLRRLTEVSSQINVTLDVPDVVKIISQEARALLGVEQAFIVARAVRHAPAQAVSLSPKYGISRSADVDLESPVAQAVCEQNRPVRLTRQGLRQHPDWSGLAEAATNELPLEGLLAVPLVGRGGRNIGYIQLSDKRAGEFNEDDESLLVQLAQLASSAIENAQLVENLREADRRKDDFLAMLAHELRNPMVPIRSGLDVLTLQSETSNDTLEVMKEQVEHMVRLVDDLLDVSRITRNKVELRKEKVELRPLIKRSIDTVRNMINDHHHTLQVSSPDKELWLEADPVRIVQAVENLLTNACKYMEPGGRIELQVIDHVHEVEIVVRDTGMGIEPELLPNVFDLFTQASRSIDRSQGGLGIGLTLVQRLVRMHGGEVTAVSEGLGHGSTFTIRLPLAERSTATAAPASQPLPVQPRRILVVDDNRGARFLMTKLLALLGDHQVQTADDGPTALALIKDSHPEIVLLDIGLPLMDGYEVGRKVRADRELDDILMIALTGYGQPEDRERSKDAGFDEHMVKPPSIDQVRSILAHQKLQ